MARLEILVKDGGIEENETTPVTTTANTNPAQPKAPNQTKSLMTGALLLTFGRQAINSGVSLIGDVTGDYALERKIKSGLSTVGLVAGLVVNAPLTLGALAIQQAAEAVSRNRTIFRKTFTAQQNQVITGQTRSNNSRKGGQK